MDTQGTRTYQWNAFFLWSQCCVCAREVTKADYSGAVCGGTGRTHSPNRLITRKLCTRMPLITTRPLS